MIFFSAPTVNIDKCESVHVVLPPNLQSDVVSAKTSALNLTYKLSDGEYEVKTWISQTFFNSSLPLLERHPNP